MLSFSLGPKRLGPRGFFRFAYHNILTALDESKIAEEKPIQPIPLIQVQSSYKTYAAQFNKQNHTIFLLKPAFDLDKHNPSMTGGMTLLSEALAWVVELTKRKNRKQAIFIVPLAECGPSGLWGAPRQHWTFLAIQGKQAYFFDPKSNKGHFSTSSRYSLDLIKKAIIEAGFTLKDPHYVGWQEEWDNTACGYFAAVLIKRLIVHCCENKKLEELNLELWGQSGPINEILKNHGSSLKTHYGICDQLLTFDEKGARPPTENWGEDLEEVESQPESKEQKEEVAPSEDLTQSGELVPDLKAPHLQLEKDYLLITAAINLPGTNALSADMLKKIYALLYVGDFYYLKNNKWLAWSTAPIVAALCHGSRVLVQLADDLDEKNFIDWLLPKEAKEQYRYTSTHKIERIESLVIKEEKIVKKVKEGKAPFIEAGLTALTTFASSVWSSLSGGLSPPSWNQFGINLAIGGAGGRHDISRNPIDSDGRHGQAFVYYLRAALPTPENKVAQSAALLIGIEQSAPIQENQQGGHHDLLGTPPVLSPTDGTFFGDERWEKVEGVPDTYRDSLFVLMAPSTFERAKRLAEEKDITWLNKPHQALPPQEIKPEATSAISVAPEEETEKETKEEEKTIGEIEKFIADFKEMELSPKSPVPKIKPILSEDKPTEAKEEIPFNLPDLTPQKNFQAKTACFCFISSITASGALTVFFWSVGGVLAVGVGIVSAAYGVLLAVLLAGVYYAYQVRQTKQLMQVTTQLKDKLTDSKEILRAPLNASREIANEIGALNTISTSLKLQLYRKLQTVLEEKVSAPLTVSQICQSLMDGLQPPTGKFNFNFFHKNLPQEVKTTLETIKNRYSSSVV